MTLLGAKAAPFGGVNELLAPGLLNIVRSGGAPVRGSDDQPAGFSSDTAAVNISLTFFVKRICGTRSQSKPGRYCPSIVSGMFSDRATDPLFESGDQAPGLAEQQVAAEGLVGDIREVMAHARREAVALVVVRGSAGAAEVAFDVGFSRPGIAVRSLEQGLHAALPLGQVELAQVIVVRIGIGNRRVEVRCPVRRLVAVTVDHHQLHEPAECYFDRSGHEAASGRG